MFIYWSKIESSGHETAYALLEKAWQAQMGTSMPQVVRTEQGKPYFVGNQLYFSLSHTKELAVCAISSRPVGVDVEQIRPIKDRLSQRVLTPGELAWAEERSDGFFYLWTRKEAYVKYTGQGFQSAPQRVDTTKLPEGLNIQSWRVEDCILTVCGEETVQEPMEKPSML